MFREVSEFDVGIAQLLWAVTAHGIALMKGEHTQAQTSASQLLSTDRLYRVHKLLHKGIDLKCNSKTLSPIFGLSWGTIANNCRPPLLRTILRLLEPEKL